MKWFLQKVSTLTIAAMACVLLAPMPARADGTSDLLSALTALKAHVTGTTPLSAAQIDAHKKTIDANVARFGDTKTVIASAFDLVSTYDSKIGPLFATAAHASFTRATVTANPADIHWTIYTVMQDLMDKTYTTANIATYEAVMNGFKFGSSSNFPGACAAPTDPNLIYTVAIKGSYEDTWGWPTFSDGPDTFARKPTGAYLAPGTIATVTVPQSLVGKGFKIRVGCHSWDFSNKPTIKRLDRVSRVYDINALQTKVANPLGGGIYIEVPYLASAGVVNVQIKNAARSPFFSATSHHKTTLAQWLDSERNFKAPWADFQSDKFMMQVPTSWIYALPDPVTLMTNWDLAMDATNDLMGFPHLRGKEPGYDQVDLLLRGSAYFPGVPTVNNTYSPTGSYGGYANSYLVRGPQFAPDFEFHELGHSYLFPKFPGEVESEVNLLHVAVLNQKLGFSLNEAFRTSMRGHDSDFYTLDTTAMAWMLCFNFVNGVPMDKVEKQYQLKGHAKFVDIARLFGWSALNNYWYSFTRDYQNNIDRPTDVDSLLLRLSKNVGADIRPLFHFWGVPPVNASALATAIKAANLPANSGIYSTLVHYKSLVPADNAAFHAFALSWWGKQPSITGYTEERNHAEQWDTYNPASCTAIKARAQKIIDLYFSNGVNHPPVANVQSVTTTLNTAKAITLTGSDPDSDALTYAIVTQPTHGTLTGTAPSVTYTPTANYSGSDTFTFKVTDSKGASSANATVSITVSAAVNHPPVANAQSVTTAFNTAKAITLTGTDPDGDTITYAIVTQPAHGKLTGTAPSVTYTPTANYSGSDSFTFKVTDSKGASSANATVSITVTPVVNRPPVANAQSVTTDINIAKAITLTGSDPDGDTLTYAIVTQPAHGKLTGTAPSVTYTPTASYSGSDSFTFKVTDSKGVSSSNATVSITVNDNGGPAGYTWCAYEHQTIVFSKVVDVAYGARGKFNYKYGVTGSITFNNATFGDPLVGVFKAGFYKLATNHAPVANAQSVTTTLNTAKAITLAGSDADGDTLTYTIVTQPAHGKLTGTVPNVTYTPTAGYSGSDSFTFDVMDSKGASSPDATVTVNITADNLVDTDHDGLPDRVETGTGIFVDKNNTGTSPTKADSDGDGVGDWYEVYASFTDPNKATSKPNIPYPLPDPSSTPPSTTKPVKVFIMMGQSNMVGMGEINGTAKGTLETICKRENEFPNLVDGTGAWTVRNDVMYEGVIAAIGHGPLKPGIQGTTIGPEMGFGHVMGYYYDEPVLLIKSSQGGRSLGWDFLPPGSQRYTVNGTTYAGYKDTTASWPAGTEPPPPQPGAWYAGKQYDDCVAAVHDVLKNFGTKYPAYKNQGFEIAGFVWWQGWNDGMSYTTAWANRYEVNMVNFIKALRNEFKVPNASFVLGSVGFGGWSMTGNMLTVANAQLAVSGEKGKYPEFAGNVKTMETRGYWRTPEESPNTAQGYHYWRNAETYMLVGDALGRGMIDLKRGSR